MDYFDRVDRAIGYIENNLTSRLDLARVADVACCSLFHFHRVFSGITGLGLAEYIRERRLTEAALRLTQGDESILDIALDCGFSSQEAFTRAFKDAYRKTPGVFRKGGIRFPLRNRLTLRTKNDGTNLKEIPMLWDRYITSGGPKKIPGKVDPWRSIGACGHAEPDGFFSYIAGEIVEGKVDVPDGMEAWTIPAATYAVFPAEGPVPNAIQDMWKYIYGTWLPGSDTWERADTEDFELYDERMEQDPPVVDIYIPVRKKG